MRATTKEVSTKIRLTVESPLAVQVRIEVRGEIFRSFDLHLFELGEKTWRRVGLLGPLGGKRSRSGEQPRELIVGQVVELFLDQFFGGHGDQILFWNYRTRPVGSSSWSRDQPVSSPPALAPPVDTPGSAGHNPAAQTGRLTRIGLGGAWPTTCLSSSSWSSPPAFWR